MATKLNPATAKKVKALGINAKSEEDAREKLLEILKDNGIDGMEEEDTETLIDIAESFVEEGGETESEEQEAEELANEAEEEETEEEKPKAKGKKAPAKDDDDEEEEEETEEPEEEETEEGDEFDEMDRTELKAYIKKNELEITVKKSMTDDDIRDLIREAVNDEEEEAEEEAEAAKKAETKAPEKPAKKKEEKKETKSKPAGKRGTKLDPKNNEDDRKAFAPLKKLFPEDEFNYAWVASAGVTIKHKGTNSNRSMVLIENCSQMPDGSIKCNLYLLTFNKQLEVLDEAGIEYEKCWSGAPLIKGITLDEAIEIIKGLLDNILSSVKKIDKKLGENRKKMEENLNKKAPKKAAKPSKDDDDEEEEEKPKAKPAAKKAVATKKTTKKK